MTIAIILSTHGSASEQLLKTTEMIIGMQKNIACVNLLPEENVETLIKKYSMHLSTLNIKKGVLFLVDTWGGSPFNAANHIILNKKNYDIITGINIPMLMEICMAREDICSYKELVQIALKCGKDSIKSVKYASENTNNNTSINTKTISTMIKHDINAKSTFHDTKKNHMIICLARIDDRLIHGQVVTRWAKEYNIKRIIVVNDEIAKDTIRNTLIKQATPPGITAHIVDINKFIRVYNNPKYSKEKVIILFNNPSDVLRLIEKGIPITSVNIGGMAFYQGKKQINNAVSVNKIDITAFKKLNHYGIILEIRKVPSDSPIEIMHLINDINE